jgi:hypothetical protein
VLQLASGHTLHQSADLDICLLDLVLVVRVLVLVCNDLLQAIIFHLLVVQQQVLNFCLQVTLFM